MKSSIEFIISQFPLLSEGQIKQVKNLSETSLTSAINYCKMLFPGVEVVLPPKDKKPRKRYYKTKNCYTHWSKQEVRFLKKNYTPKNVTNIAKTLNRTPEAIMVKAHRLGLVTGYNKRWNETEIDYIVENINNMTYNQIACKLNRSKRSITSMVARLRTDGELL